MNPLSQLPVECLQHILHIIHNDDDFSALARLLLMNKHIASATLPFLYRDPFRLKPDKLEAWNRHRSRPRYYDKLIRMLLSQLPLATLPTAVSLVFAASSADSSPAMTTVTATNSNSPLDYLAHIRHLNIPLPDRKELRWSHLSNLQNSHQSAYIQSDEFDQLYQSNPFLSRSATSVGDKVLILRRYYHIMFYHEILWSLAHPILEQLQSFSIPMHHFDRYQGVVDRFQNLGLVHFMTSDVFEPIFDEDLDTDSEPDSEPDARNGKRRAMMQRRDELVQKMRRFVQDHVQLFKGRLKSVRCLEDDVWRNRFLPKAWEDIVCNKQSILQRCRALERLQLQTVRAGAFKWAVQEKNDIEQKTGRSAVVKNDRVGWRTLEHDEKSSSAHRIHDLVPLKYVTIRRSSSMDTEDIDDILFAFNHTLRVVSITEQTFSKMEKPTSRHIGHGMVPLPALTFLNLALSSERLMLDPGLLSNCPNLTSFHVRDLTLTYSCRDIVACLPARLDRLGVLQLSGWPALSFDPATLFSTARLGSLSMGVYPWSIGHGSGPRGFTPPVEELYLSYGIQDGALAPPLPTTSTIATDLELGNIRPRWTWDWHLPHLTRLDLNSEFAYLFKFKMLQGCPALTTLYLNITSTMLGTHTRVISESDLFLPTNTSTHSNSDSNSSNESSGFLPPMQHHQSTHDQRQRLCSPSVTSLSLRGDWVIDQEIMPQFLAGMFPNCKNLFIAEWNLPAKQALVKVFRDMPTKYDDALLKVYMFRPSSYEMDRLGIVAYREDADPEDYLSVKLVDMGNLDKYRLLKPLLPLLNTYEKWNPFIN
ncbi:hypothetical protein BGZ90_008282 [Linnemannia elongata]|nr:hypothetical protein BGZ90_008282 [Linnemannia elongata]